MIVTQASPLSCLLPSLRDLSLVPAAQTLFLDVDLDTGFFCVYTEYAYANLSFRARSLPTSIPFFSAVGSSYDNPGCGGAQAHDQNLLCGRGVPPPFELGGQDRSTQGQQQIRAIRGVQVTVLEMVFFLLLLL